MRCKKLKIPAKIIFDHHLSHAWSAFVVHLWKKLVFTLDGRGDLDPV